MDSDIKCLFLGDDFPNLDVKTEKGKGDFKLHDNQGYSWLIFFSQIEASNQSERLCSLVLRNFLTNTKRQRLYYQYHDKFLDGLHKIKFNYHKFKKYGNLKYIELL